MLRKHESFYEKQRSKHISLRLNNSNITQNESVHKHTHRHSKLSHYNITYKQWKFYKLPPVIRVIKRKIINNIRVIIATVHKDSCIHYYRIVSITIF